MILLSNLCLYETSFMFEITSTVLVMIAQTVAWLRCIAGKCAGHYLSIVVPTSLPVCQ